GEDQQRGASAERSERAGGPAQDGGRQVHYRDSTTTVVDWQDRQPAVRPSPRGKGTPRLTAVYRGRAFPDVAAFGPPPGAPPISAWIGGTAAGEVKTASGRLAATRTSDSSSFFWPSGDTRCGASMIWPWRCQPCQSQTVGAASRGWSCSR